VRNFGSVVFLGHRPNNLRGLLFSVRDSFIMCVDFKMLILLLDLDWCCCLFGS